MNCPYCGKSMKYGKIYGIGGRGAFWLPGDSMPFHFITRKNIVKFGGLALAETTIGFIATDHAVGYYCASCKKLIFDIGEHTK